MNVLVIAAITGFGGLCVKFGYDWFSSPVRQLTEQDTEVLEHFYKVNTAVLMLNGTLISLEPEIRKSFMNIRKILPILVSGNFIEETSQSHYRITIKGRKAIKFRY